MCYKCFILLYCRKKHIVYDAYFQNLLKFCDLLHDQFLWIFIYALRKVYSMPIDYKVYIFRSKLLVILFNFSFISFWEGQFIYFSLYLYCFLYFEAIVLSMYLHMIIIYSCYSISLLVWMIIFIPYDIFS